jgi:hypothetical protein
MPTVTGTFAYLSDFKCFFGWVSGTKDSQAIFASWIFRLAGHTTILWTFSGVRC